MKQKKEKKNLKTFTKYDIFEFFFLFSYNCNIIFFKKNNIIEIELETGLTNYLV